MQATIPQLVVTLQEIFGPVADQLGRESGFIQRQGKLTGSSFVQALVFGFAGNPASTYGELSQSTSLAGTPVSSQAVEQRFTALGAEFLKAVLEKMVGVVLTEVQPSCVPLFARFQGVYLRDSTILLLPAALQDIWEGSGGTNGPTAALKLQVNFNYASGQVQGPSLQAGKCHDQTSPYQDQALPPGALHLADLGYFSLARLGADDARGVYFLTRLKAGTVLAGADGQRLDLLRELQRHPETTWELPIQLGAQQRLPSRLLVERVPQEVADGRRRKLRAAARKRGQTVSAERLALAAWTLAVTNVPPEKLSRSEARVLLRVRWQVELLFKLWKSHQQIDTWRSQKPWRILGEIYAKLMGVVMYQWIFMVGLWSNPRRSLRRAAALLQKFALPLALAIREPSQLSEVLHRLVECLGQSPSVETRHQHPSTAQQLAAIEVTQ